MFGDFIDYQQSLFSLILVMNQRTILPGERGRSLRFGGFGQMQPAGEVEADPLGFSAGPAEDGASLVLHPLRCLVEERVLGVVLHAVGDDEVEVGLELLQAPVVVAVDAFPHGGEVHGVLDVVQVVRYLQGTEETCRRLQIV